MSWVAHDLEPYVFRRKRGKVPLQRSRLRLGPIWATAALLTWGILRRGYFRERIAPSDGGRAWSGRRMPEDPVP
jgi:hypothetical protein